MKIVYSTPDRIQLGFLKGVLEQAEIPFVTSNEHLAGSGAAAGEVPPFLCLMDLSVPEEHFERARGLIAGALEDVNSEAS